MRNNIVHFLHLKRRNEYSIQLDNKELLQKRLFQHVGFVAIVEDVNTDMPIGSQLLI